MNPRSFLQWATVAPNSALVSDACAAAQHNADVRQHDLRSRYNSDRGSRPTRTGISRSRHRIAARVPVHNWPFGFSLQKKRTIMRMKTALALVTMLTATLASAQ